MMEIEAAIEWEFKPIEFNEKNDGVDCQIGHQSDLFDTLLDKLTMSHESLTATDNFFSVDEHFTPA